jgi:dolichol-phosphate mannosyltransferase
MIPQFVAEWEQGYKLVMATKPYSKGSALIHFLRKLYYRVLDGISDITILNNCTGFGLYDKVVLDHLRALHEPYPFLRGLICELGFEIKTIPFVQPRRRAGITKNNFYTLYDIAMLGIITHSKLPIRIAAFFGFLLGLVSMVVGIVFVILKLIYWDSFPIGIAPVVIGMFFLLGIQLMFIGILGEYIGSIHTYLQKRPLVVEKERINFD